MQKLQRALRWCNVILVLITLLVYLGPFVNPQGSWPIAALGLFYPAILTCHLFFILLWAFWRKWPLALSLGCILIGWGQMRTIVGLAPAPKTDLEAMSTTLKIMTFNCHSFEGRTKKQLAVEEKLKQLIGQNRPDILCFQEFASTESELKTFRAWVKNSHNYPYALIQTSPSLAIFSVYPLEQQHAQHFEHSYNGYQQADININGYKVRLFNLHLQTNAVSHLADKVTSSGDLKSKETWLDIGGMLRRYQRAARIRVGQIREVLNRTQGAPHPVILCGDLNDVPQSYVYRLLKQGRTDTFQRAGRGLGMTYSGKIPGLRIDYIFTPPEYIVLETKILRPGFSDHRPVMSTVLMEN